jgi:hypothetical protein
MPSRVIHSFSYHEDDRRLIVRFVGGRVYSYAEVPAEIAKGLASAPSRGRYFGEHVRDRFAFDRLRTGWPA